MKQQMTFSIIVTFVRNAIKELLSFNPNKGKITRTNRKDGSKTT